MNSSNLMYVVIIFLKLKNILIKSVNLSFTKKLLFKMTKDLIIFPYISHRSKPSIFFPSKLSDNKP